MLCNSGLENVPVVFHFQIHACMKTLRRHALHYRETVSVRCFVKVNHQKRCRCHVTVFSLYYIALFMNIRQNVTIEGLCLDSPPPSRSKSFMYLEFPKYTISQLPWVSNSTIICFIVLLNSLIRFRFTGSCSLVVDEEIVRGLCKAL